MQLHAEPPVHAGSRYKKWLVPAAAAAAAAVTSGHYSKRNDKNRENGQVSRTTVVVIVRRGVLRAHSIALVDVARGYTHTSTAVFAHPTLSSASSSAAGSCVAVLCMSTFCAIGGYLTVAVLCMSTFCAIGGYLTGSGTRLRAVTTGPIPPLAATLQSLEPQHGPEAHSAASACTCPTRPTPALHHALSRAQ